MTDRPSRVVAVFGASGSQPGDGRYEEGVECGRLLAAAGFGVITGGYGGTMEAVSLGAAATDGHVIGVTAPTVFPNRPGGNDHLTEEVEARSLVDRIGTLLDTSDASIALWGSLGTATELLAAWNLAYVAPLAEAQAKPIAAVGTPWTRLVPHLVESLDTDPALVTVFDDVPSAVEWLAGRLA